jgi:hypothetical protein
VREQGEKARRAGGGRASCYLPFLPLLGFCAGAEPAAVLAGFGGESWGALPAAEAAFELVALDEPEPFAMTDLAQSEMHER